jgi:hypothetical protein
MEVQGTLNEIVTELLPEGHLGRLRTGWVIRANGQTFEVDFGGDAKLLEQARKLSGKRVLLTGKHQLRFRPPRLPRPVHHEIWPHRCVRIRGVDVVEVVRVTAIEEAPAEYVRDAAQVKGVRVSINYGLTSLPNWAELEGSSLTRQELRQLRRLVEEAIFFALKDAEGPGARLTVTVEMDGRTHTVRLNRANLPQGMRALLDWVEARATHYGPLEAVKAA